MGLDEPVSSEDDVQLGYGRPGQADGELSPFTPCLVVLRLVIARLDEILRTRDSDETVHDQYLAMVAQVRAAPATLERQDRQHGVPQEAGFVEFGLHLLVSRDPARRQMVEKHSNCDASFHRPGAGLEEGPGYVVPGHDEILDIDEALRALDLRRHGRDRLLVVREELCAVPPGARQR